MTPVPEQKNEQTEGVKNFSTGQNLSKKQQKFALLLVAFIGFLAIGIAVYQFFHTLRAPFAIKNVALNINGLTTQQALIEGLRTKDTDEDGISDYDELYTYRTSPYLADSDSDKISDKDELAAGKNPNCPEGKDCLQPSITNTNSLVVIPGTPQASDIPIATLRQTLKDAGAPEDVLNGMSDDELRQLYQEVVQEQGGAQNLNAGASDATISLSTLQNLTPSEIRQFLIQSGISESTLNDVNDEQLQAIFQEALAQYTQ